jgi:hypothetical protein
MNVHEALVMAAIGTGAMSIAAARGIARNAPIDEELIVTRLRTIGIRMHCKAYRQTINPTEHSNSKA